jgi:hypothetical protein
VDLIEIGHGAVSLGKVADATDRGDVTVHRIQALEDDQLRPVRLDGLQQCLEMIDIVVPPDLPLASRMSNALDHRVVVHGVR